MTRSKVQRALLVLALWIGFYALGLLLSGLLLYLPVAQARYDELQPTGILCALLGVWMLVSLVPIPRRYEKPGAALADGAHPALEALVRRVAERAGQPVPKHVYLVHEATAFTTREPKWLGLASDPIVGIGLPLFELLDANELEAVLAHELGHHWGGDVRLGPWIRRTHLAIAQALERFEGSSLWLHMPFVLYGNMFVRVTHESSRAQELAADALAAKLCGSKAIAGALSRLEERGSSWNSYFWHEVIPMLEHQRAPALWSGFEIFQREIALDAEWVIGLAKHASRKTSDLDTHPVLADRLAALGETGFVHGTQRGCWELLTSREAAEQHVFANLLVSGDPSKLKPIEWSQVGDEVWIPEWRARLSEVPALSRLSPGMLSSVFAPGSTWPEQLRRGIAVLSPAAERKRLGVLLGQWMCVWLFERGFRIEANPGARVSMRRDRVQLVPQALVEGLASGKLSAEQWQLECERIAATGVPVH